MRIKGWKDTMAWALFLPIIWVVALYDKVKWKCYKIKKWVKSKC